MDHAQARGRDRVQVRIDDGTDRHVLTGDARALATCKGVSGQSAGLQSASLYAYGGGKS